MPKFIVTDNFQFGGEIRNAGSILTISKSDLEQEVAKGKHPKRGKWLSGLLNHCEPEDDAAAEILSGKPLPQKKSDDEIADEEAERIVTVRGEMDELGAAYDRRWKLPKLENELVMAKKVRGE